MIKHDYSEMQDYKDLFFCETEGCKHSAHYVIKQLITSNAPFDFDFDLPDMFYPRLICTNCYNLLNS